MSFGVANVIVGISELFEIQNFMKGLLDIVVASQGDSIDIRQQ